MVIAPPLLSQEQEAPSTLCANGFFYLDFIWAVSCVMSRQNQIPSSNGKAAALALIPLWDMCNHSNGQITTDFDLENHCCICYASRKTASETEFTIFYGARPNSDLLLHQGFVYPENIHDSLKIKLGRYVVNLFKLVHCIVFFRVKLRRRTYYEDTAQSVIGTSWTACVSLMCTHSQLGLVVTYFTMQIRTV